MDYKEKYEQALDNLKKIKAANKDNKELVDFIENKYPELKESVKESEDERIRKELIEQVGYIIPNYDEVDSKGNILPTHEKRIAKYRAWLEKQGEQKPAVDTKVIIPKFRVGDIVKSKSQPMLEPRKIISIGKDCYWCEDRGCIGFAWEDDCEIVEQKPAWSEEDEIGLGNALWAIEQAKTIVKDENDMGSLWYAEKWLKSLRLQHHWKPSEEQMLALGGVLDYLDESDNEDADIIRKLINDLKKL